MILLLPFRRLQAFLSCTCPFAPFRLVAGNPSGTLAMLGLLVLAGIVGCSGSATPAGQTTAEGLQALHAAGKLPHWT